MSRDWTRTTRGEDPVASQLDQGPNKDLEWMQRFAENVVARPAAYNLTEVEATKIQTAVNAAVANIGSSTLPLNLKHSSTNQEDARMTAMQICRDYATYFKYDSRISDVDKQAVGVGSIQQSNNEFGRR